MLRIDGNLESQEGVVESSPGHSVVEEACAHLMILHSHPPYREAWRVAHKDVCLAVVFIPL